ncbi:hypothetical protein C0J52_10771 [Blattella germanica]|nr:hypothetical protein C0J52_10771 [Blattella germanica]
MVSTAPKSKWSAHKQRRMGPAPFASFEDLSDDLDSPEEKQSLTRILPGIREDVSLMSPNSGGGGLQTPSTPRIDISRASSSSHHDSNNSRDSSPERELYAGSGEVTGAKLGLGFKEEGAADLRSSTEELDFHEDTGTVAEREAQKRRERRAARQQQQQQHQQHTSIFKYELEAQSEKERKDSACSDVALLSISGRTSRLSSIGSGGSGASHVSGMSHLSVMSGHSAASSGRSPSPHKMLLETSFCGSKPIPTHSIDLESPPNKHETESLEKALLSRKIDPTLAIVGDIKAEQVQKKHTSRDIYSTTSKEPKNAGDTATQRAADVSLQDKSTTGGHKHEVRVVSSQEKRPVDTQRSEVRTVSPQEKRTTDTQKAELCVTIKKAEPDVQKKPVVEDRSSQRQEVHSVLSPESPTVIPSKRKSSGLSTILKEASDGIRDRSRSRSKSRERVTTPGESKGKKDNKNKSVFSTFFKKRDKKKTGRTADDDVLSPVELSTTERKLEPIGNVEFTFNAGGQYHSSDYGVSQAKEREPPRQSYHSEKDEACRVYDDDVRTEKLTKDVFSHVNNVSREDNLKVADHTDDQVAAIGRDEDNGVSSKFEPTLVEDQTLLPSESVMLPTLCQDTVIPAQNKSVEATDSASITDHHSSESERDSEVDYLKTKKKEVVEVGEEDHERKGLVVQQDSFDDELPYVPTTLPQERSVAVPIIPIKQRIAEVKTCPIERPRSTTPINPSLLEDYLHTEDSREHAVEKMRICLPREDSIGSRSKSPRRITKTWFEFAEQEIPEKRKAPKRIQTIPSRGTLDLPDVPKTAEKTVYSYVNPEECKCECHESSGRQQPPPPAPPPSVLPTLPPPPTPPQCSHSNNENSTDSSYEYPSPYSLGDSADYSEGLKPMKPFGMDLDVTSNRSSIISQDEPQSPELGSPNDNES